MTDTELAWLLEELEPESCAAKPAGVQRATPPLASRLRALGTKRRAERWIVPVAYTDPPDVYRNISCSMHDTSPRRWCRLREGSES
jgi:hypothetical protein